jgi:hypothetical protein
MNDSTFIRNAKFWGIKETTQISNIHEATTELLNTISSDLRKMIVNEDVLKIISNCKIKVSKKFVKKFIRTIPKSDQEKINTVLTSNAITDTDMKDIMSNVFKEFESPDLKIESYKRSLVKYVIERYMGYAKRNRKNKKVPQIGFQKKNMYFKDNSVRLVGEDKLEFKTIQGPLVVKYGKSLKKELLKKKTFGGNLKYHPKTKSYSFVAAVEVPFIQKYIPSVCFGFDLNKTPEHWIVFSDGSTISMPDNIQQKIETIKNVNEVLSLKNRPVNERKYEHKVNEIQTVVIEQRTKKFMFDEKDKALVESIPKNRMPRSRRSMRKMWKKLHAQLKSYATKISKEIVNKTENLNAILCMDSVKGGQEMGTFGQDYLVPEMIKICQNEGIPYYLTPCQNTSRMCSNCGHTTEENRKTTNDFECLACGKKELSHLNAAKNMKKIGEDLYKNNKPFGDYTKKFSKKKASSNKSQVAES